MESLRNMAMPLRVSRIATSCGVDTITAPVEKRARVDFAQEKKGREETMGGAPSTLTSWPRLSATSPVPGGVSITRTSRSSREPPARQSTSKRSCWTAFMTIIPRQTTGVSAPLSAPPELGRRKPIDMQGIPWARRGVRRLSGK